ncbi:hypothetical protein L1987_79560 [Smallanthus sonchifolius]|uniref:Uncharacterized protein n=1 Tax=Smallanthus sonchifolius TaxID=185202 RepID=A0ACB8ZFG7_9ASTR|nr:hypothetical protein L1987_79560 [Smallanthus sonchifolius]
MLTSTALTAAQEVVRCLLPTTLPQGIRVTVSFQDHRLMLQSVAKIPSPRLELNNTKKHELCVCTMPDAMDTTLMNVVHHFHLRKGFRYKNVRQTTAVINHYKYQVWEAFWAKFYRRVATYVADWQDNHNEGSRDRAPGLGTEAIEPSDWSLRFCEVWDSGLRDFVLGNLADTYTGLLPWDIPT